MAFRIFDDGFGFRYELPAGANIADELTEFAVASNGTAWWTPAVNGTATNSSPTAPG